MFSAGVSRVCFIQSLQDQARVLVGALRADGSVVWEHVRRRMSILNEPRSRRMDLMPAEWNRRQACAAFAGGSTVAAESRTEMIG